MSSFIDWDKITTDRLSRESPQYRHLPCITDLIHQHHACEDDRIADLGCYNGFDLINMAREINARFTGYDKCKLAIELGNAKIVQERLSSRINLKFRDISVLSDIPNDYYLITISKCVLPFLENPLFFLNEAKRITSKLLILAVPVVDDMSDSALLSRSKRISMEKDKLYSYLEEVFSGMYKIIETYPDTDDSRLSIEVFSIWTSV